MDTALTFVIFRAIAYVIVGYFAYRRGYKDLSALMACLFIASINSYTQIEIVSEVIRIGFSVATIWIGYNLIKK